MASRRQGSGRRADPPRRFDLSEHEGAGRVSRQLAERVAHLTCTDVSPTMVAEARRNLAGIENIGVAATDGFSLREYEDASFDIVLAAGMFGYIEIGPAPAIFDEVRRVLRVAACSRSTWR